MFARARLTVTLLSAVWMVAHPPAAAQTGAAAQVVAPVTVADRSKLPPEAVQALAAYDRVAEQVNAGFDAIPRLVIRATDDDVSSRSKGCQPGKHLMLASWLPGGKLAYYFGEAVNCVPQGIGIIGFVNGDTYTGEVTDYGLVLEPAKAGKKRDNIYPVQAGLGIYRTAAQMKSGGGVVGRFQLKNAALLKSCPGCQVINVAGRLVVTEDIAIQGRPFAYFPATGPMFITGVDGSGTNTPSNAGAATATFSDGTTFTGDFVNGVPKPGAVMTRMTPDGVKTVAQLSERFLPKRGADVTVTLPSGDVLRGADASFMDRKPNGPVRFRGAVLERLVGGAPEAGLPPGTYRVFHGVGTRSPMAPVGETLFAGGPQREGCLTPTFLPPGFTTFWPFCKPAGKTGADGKPVPALTVSFSNDLRQRLIEREGEGGEFRFSWAVADAKGDALRVISANRFASDPVIGPVGKASIRTRDGSFTGEFAGMYPDGPGICTVAGEDGEEPCFYVNGARTDEIHQARQEAKIAARAAKRQADALAAQQAEAQRQQQQAEAQARAAQQAAQYAADEARRAARRAAEEADDDDAPQGNPIMDALNDLSGKFRAAAVENQRGWDRVNEINAAQQRAAEARAAARQAEAAQIAQANAAAAEARAAQARNAQAVTAAEIQRRQAEAQARVAEARQRAIAQQQAAAQQQADQRRAASSQAQSSGIAGGTAAQTGPVRGNRSAAIDQIEWLEGVVICPAKEGFLGSTQCFGPFQSVLASLNNLDEIRRACGSDIPVRRMGTYGGNQVYGCNFGINPTLGNRQPHIDQAERRGVAIPDRRVFRCPAAQYQICRS